MPVSETRALDDIAGRIKDGLEAYWGAGTLPIGGTDGPAHPDRDLPNPDYHPTWVATLHVDDDYSPLEDEVTLLVCDDGGPRAFLMGHWPSAQADQPRGIMRRPLLRLTAFAAGRSDARAVAVAAADWVCNNKRAVGIARIEDVSDPLITRDRATGAYLASVTMPAIVRPA